MAIDWTKGMIQTYEYYVVNPETWLDDDRLDCITESDIDRDLDTETRHSFRAVTTEAIPECYVRVYLCVNQNGEKDKIPLGTFLSYVPSIEFTGTYTRMDVEGYSPIIELREKMPPIGTYVAQGSNIMARIRSWIEEYARAPFVKPSETLLSPKTYVAEVDDTWLSFISGVLEDNGYFLNVDALGRIYIDKDINPMFLQPKWTFSDGADSILCRDVTVEQDILEVPNVMEVVISDGENNGFTRYENTSKASPVSIPSRGRRIVKRIVNPQTTTTGLYAYAKNELMKESTIETSVSYSHGYCPVKTGDCIMLNYEKFNLYDMKLKVVKQSISCRVGCTVTETAVSTTNLM